MAPDHASPTEPITPLDHDDPDEDHPDQRRSPRARAVLALGVVLLGSAVPAVPAVPATTMSVAAGSQPTSASTRPSLPARQTATAEAITDVWDRR